MNLLSNSFTGWLKLRAPIVESRRQNDISIIDEAQLLMDALDGFFVMMSHNGELIYVSENVEEYLGLAQTELMGNNILDVSHPCDQTEVKELLSLKFLTNGPSPTIGILRSPKTNSDLNDLRQQSGPLHLPCCFFIRMKCPLTSKGRSVNIKSATYKVKVICQPFDVLNMICTLAVIYDLWLTHLGHSFHWISY